jgi:hypothetical protein
MEAVNFRQEVSGILGTSFLLKEYNNGSYLIDKKDANITQLGQGRVDSDYKNCHSLET